MDGGEQDGVVAGFDVGHLDVGQRKELSRTLTEAGILHSFVGPELQAPAAESELVQQVIELVLRDEVPRAWPTFDLPPDPFVAAAPVLSARWRRLAAYVVEAVAFGVITLSLTAVSPAAAQVFAIVAGLVSSIVLVAVIGSTFGMWLLRMRVVVPPASKAPGWAVAVVRYVVAWWPAILLMIDVWLLSSRHVHAVNVIAQVWVFACFGPILFDPLRRGLHDRVAGTLVVDIERRAT